VAETITPLEVDRAIHEHLPWAAWAIVDIVFPSTAYTDCQIVYPTNLFVENPEEVQYTVLRQATPGTVYEDRSSTRTPWGRGFIILRSDLADWTGRLLITTLKTPKKFLSVGTDVYP
jgi:hypothetical protein